MFATPTLSSDSRPKAAYDLSAKDVFFQPGAGIRVRYENLRNATGEAFPNDEDESQASHRAQFDFRLYKGEFIETFFQFLNQSDWGEATSNSSAGQKDSFAKTNGILVNQAWGIWNVDDSFNVLIGRAPIHLGLGYTYGRNDWFNVPYSFDQVKLGADWESLKLDFIAVKVQEFSQVDNQTLSSDPEENHYILNLDIKNLVDSIDTFTFYVVQVNRDLGSNDGEVSVLNGLNMQRLGVEAEIQGKNMFGSLFFTYITGEEKVAPINQVDGVDKISIKQTALDLRLGYGLPTLSNLRFWGGYHFDSGDSNTSDTENKSYSSHFYEVYGQSGVMDIIRWGNLSMFRLGAQVDLSRHITLGTELLMMSRTEALDAINFGEAGRFYRDRIAAGDIVIGEDTNTGREFDIWLDFAYESGVDLRVTYSHFFPGGAFANAVTTSGNSADTAFFQFLSQVGYSF